MNKAATTRLEKLEARQGLEPFDELDDQELERAIEMTRELMASPPPKDLEELAGRLGWSLEETAKINDALIEGARRLGLGP